MNPPQKEASRAARRDIVGVDQRFDTERAFNDGVLADEPFGERRRGIPGFQAVLELLQEAGLGGAGRDGRIHDDAGSDHMIEQMEKIDKLDLSIISCLQKDGALSQRELADRVGLSQNACWRRLQRLNACGIIRGTRAEVSLVALGLDLLIRRGSAGRHSLDDVMRLLWERYGRDFYQGNPQGLPEDGLPALIQEATGVDARRCIARHAYGTADVPLAELLAAEGITLHWKTAANIPSLDVRTRKQGDSLLLATVLEGGAGHQAGLSAGDVLVAVDGLRVDAPAGLDLLLAQYRPGDRVTVHVFRRDELRAFRVRLTAPEALDCVLTV
ncbi:hypothetical protein G6F57_014378 [Rhizopus arrhizus]|nr:hypothetical protein G6F57_014378 [Rhizopus arrhizus]